MYHYSKEEFYVFYSGTAPQPSEQTLYLSDSYLEKTDSPMLELKTKIININLPVNHAILQKSRAMYEYSWFVQRIRDYLEAGNSRDRAITLAMKDCMKEGVMTDFIRTHGSEVENMLFTEFNLEDAMEVWKEEAYEDGREAGHADGANQILQLIANMTRDGMTESISRLTSDAEFCEEMIRKYNL